MLRALLLSLLCLTVPVSAMAESAAKNMSPLIASLTQGVYCEVPSVGSMQAPGTIAGRIDLYDTTPEFQWLSTRVPAVLGLSFGIRTQTLGGQMLGGVVITLTHPPMGARGTTSQSYVTQLGGNGPSINAYTFDLPEEMVTGTWTFTASQDGREVYSASFEVVPPMAEPQIANSCGFAPMS